MSQLNQRECKLKQVQQLCFMIDDLRLYLDTHPQCQEALTTLQRYIALERTARREYEQAYGPLTLDAVENLRQYDWVSPCWPWKVEG